MSALFPKRVDDYEDAEKHRHLAFRSAERQDEFLEVEIAASAPTEIAAAPCRFAPARHFESAGDCGSTLLIGQARAKWPASQGVWCSHDSF